MSIYRVRTVFVGVSYVYLQGSYGLCRCQLCIFHTAELKFSSFQVRQVKLVSGFNLSRHPSFGSVLGFFKFSCEDSKLLRK